MTWMKLFVIVLNIAAISALGRDIDQTLQVINVIRERKWRCRGGVGELIICLIAILFDVSLAIALVIGMFYMNYLAFFS